MSKFMASWLAAASEVLEAEFGSSADLLPGAAISAEAASFTLVVDIAGAWEGTFSATADEAALAALLGAAKAGGEEAGAAPLPAAEARAEWERLFGKICVAAAAGLGSGGGGACEVAFLSAGEAPVGAGGMGYQLLAGGAMAALVLADQVERAAAEPPRPAAAPSAPPPPPPAPAPPPPPAAEAPIDQKGMDLLLDVELEASLRFGSREMTLADLLALGPGDVIQLDRALTDPVDLIIGDKIVARGEVVLVNGNFGLEIAEVAEPRKSLESIRCLF
jgi:flagellar motor switch protein FliN/FliY